MGIFYISTKFELYRSTYNGDLLSGRNHWKHRHTDTHTYTHRETEIVTFPIKNIGSSNKLVKEFSFTSRYRKTLDLGPRFYVSCERQGQHIEQQLDLLKIKAEALAKIKNLSKKRKLAQSMTILKL